MKSAVSSIILSIASWLAAPLAHALTVPPPPTGQLPTSPITSTGDVSGLVCGLLPWIFWGLIVLAIVMALIAAYKYVTAAGEPEKVSDASKTLLYAAIAVAVAIIAQGTPYIVNSFIGGGFTSSVCAGGGPSNPGPGYVRQF